MLGGDLAGVLGGSVRAERRPRGRAGRRPCSRGRRRCAGSGALGGNLAGDRGRHRGEGADLVGVLDGDLAVVLGAAFCVVGNSRATGQRAAA
jgi:hypothetical protein